MVSVVFAMLVVAGCGATTTPPPDQAGPVTDISWSSADVGVVGFEGESLLGSDEGSVVVRGSGRDVWYGEDGFRFTFVPLAGDGSLTVRVDELLAVDEWTKAGVMVREGLAPDARNAFMLLTDFYGVVFQGRLEVGAPTSDTLPDGHVMRTAEPVAPWWLRIERRGSTLIGSHSPDAVAWSELGRLSIALPQDVLIGMAVTSRTNDAAATAVFSNVTLERASVGHDGDVGDGDGGGGDGDGGGGGGDGGGGGALPPVPITGPTVSTSYLPSLVDFPNPERGWHGAGDSPSSYAGVASRGFTLVRRYVRLDDYRYQPLPSWLLDQLDSDLAALRTHGLKMVLRFSYNFGFTDDAPLDRVLGHIEQLTPILREHADVIAVLQAGFIGAWGEWHSSTHGLLTLENRTTITRALLDAMDGSRMIQIRTPYLARDMFPTPPVDGTVFNGSDASRVAQKNDCFLSSGNDGGTFLSEADYVYTEAVTRYTVMGGETCSLAGLSSRNDGAVAVVELARFHYDYLNHDFWTPILDKWRSQGYYDEITRRLGYRYVMLETISQASAERGQTLSLNVRLQNEGFGKLYNPRPINVVLRPVAGGAPITLRGHDDARQLLPLAGETRTVPLTVRIPNTAPAGEYDVFLALPDAAASLQNDPRYALRFANDDTWQATDGHNTLNLRITIE